MWQHKWHFSHSNTLTLCWQVLHWQTPWFTSENVEKSSSYVLVFENPFSFHNLSLIFHWSTTDLLTSQPYRQGPGVPRPIPPRQTQVPVWRRRDVAQLLLFVLYFYLTQFSKEYQRKHFITQNLHHLFYHLKHMKDQCCSELARKSICCL